MHDPRSPAAPTAKTASEPLLEAPAPIASGQLATPPPDAVPAPPTPDPSDEPGAAAPDRPPTGDTGSTLWVGFLAGLALLLASFIWLALIASPPGG